MIRAKRPSSALMTVASLISGITLTSCSPRDIIFFYPQITVNEYMSKINTEIGDRAIEHMNSVGLEYDSLQFLPKEISYGYQSTARGEETITFYDATATQGDKKFNIDFSYKLFGHGLQLEDMGRSQFTLNKDMVYYLGDIETLGSMIGDKNSILSSVVDSTTKQTYFTLDQNNLEQGQMI